MSLQRKLVAECVEKFRDLLRVDSNGVPQELDSLTIASLSHAVSEITGLDFFELYENISLEDLQTVDSFERSLTQLVREPSTPTGSC